MSFDPDTDENKAILDCFWDHLRHSREHPDRVRTGWGTKTQQGLCATVRRLGRRQGLEPTILQTRQLLRLIRTGIPGDRKDLATIEALLESWLHFGAEGPDHD